MCKSQKLLWCEGAPESARPNQEINARGRALLMVCALSSASAFAASCGAAVPPAFFGRLEGTTEIFFAHEPVPSCQLEASSGERAPERESQWVKVPTNGLTNRQFAIVQ